MSVNNITHSQNAGGECCCSHCQHCSCSSSHSASCGLTCSNVSSPDVYEKCVWKSKIFHLTTPDEQTWSSVAYLTDNQVLFNNPITSYIPKTCPFERLILPYAVEEQPKTSKILRGNSRYKNLEIRSGDITEFTIACEEVFIMPSIHKQHRRCSIYLETGAYSRDYFTTANTNHKKIVTTTPASIKNQATEEAKCLNFASITIHSSCQLHRCREINVCLPYHRYAKVKMILPFSLSLCFSIVSDPYYQQLTFSMVSYYYGKIQKIKSIPWEVIDNQKISSFIVDLNSFLSFQNVLPKSNRKSLFDPLSSFTLKTKTSDPPLNVCQTSPSSFSYRCRHSHRRYRSELSKFNSNRGQHISSYLEECLHNKQTQTDQVIIVPIKAVKKFKYGRITPKMLNLPSLVPRTRFHPLSKISRSNNNANANISSSEWERVLLYILGDEECQTNSISNMNPKISISSECHLFKSLSSNSTIEESLTFLKSTHCDFDGIPCKPSSQHQSAKSFSSDCQTVVYVDVFLEDNDDRAISPFLIPFLQN